MDCSLPGSSVHGICQARVGALAMFFTFYGLTILCMVLAARGWLAPFPAAVFPDLVFLALGVRLFWKNR